MHNKEPQTSIICMTIRSSGQHISGIDINLVLHLLETGRQIGLMCRNMAIPAQTLHQYEADQLAGDACESD